jgi:hypothetical protein
MTTNTDYARATFARATGGEYDAEYERELARAITQAIIDASTVSDVDVTAIRIAEVAEALIATLAVTLSMSPAVTRSPTTIRKTVDELGKRLHRRIVEAQADPDLQDLVRRTFPGGDVGGTA